MKMEHIIFLKELLKDIYSGPLPRGPRGSLWEESSRRQLAIRGIGSDSRTVEKDSLFVALKGAKHDGAQFIDEAIKKGARVVASSHPPAKKRADVLFLHVDDPHKFLHEVTRRFYGPLSSKVKSIGVTGTNGKTTITYLIESILHEAGKTCGVMGTVNCRIGKKVLPSKNTTPGLVENQQFLAKLAEKEVEYCVMEVSSHGLDQGRVELIDFKSAVFTNLTSDHLDYHRTRENYFLAKARLFTNLSPRAVSVINIDDPYGAKLVSMTKSRVVKYGISGEADICAKDIKTSVLESHFTVRANGQSIEVRTKLIGLHNVYNILAAAGVCFNEGIALETIRRGIARLEHVPGRLDRIESPKGFAVFIDYAHTEDALKNVLEALRKIGPRRIITVFGCGGDRDKTKRPKMGRVAGHLSDVVIVTNDNPRSEDPQSIISGIILGFSTDNYQVVGDREKAIQTAIAMAGAGDIVLIAGKGHEDYQIFKDRTIAFDERAIVKKYLK